MVEKSAPPLGRTTSAASRPLPLRHRTGRSIGRVSPFNWSHSRSGGSFQAASKRARYSSITDSSVAFFQHYVAVVDVMAQQPGISVGDLASGPAGFQDLMSIAAVDPQTSVPAPIQRRLYLVPRTDVPDLSLDQESLLFA